MAEYSAPPLAKKLGLKAGSYLALVGAPKDYGSLIGPAPENMRIGDRISTTTDIDLRPLPARPSVHVFSTRRPELERFLLSCRAKLKPGAATWVSWPMLRKELR